jgi:DNA-binding response OmpR family regulator
MPKKILVVEDDPDARALIESILKLSGLSVVLAADGKEGLQRAQIESGMEKAMEAIKAGANRALARPVQNHLLLAFVFDLLNQT